MTLWTSMLVRRRMNYASLLIGPRAQIAIATKICCPRWQSQPVCKSLTASTIDATCWNTSPSKEMVGPRAPSNSRASTTPGRATPSKSASIRSFEQFVRLLDVRRRLVGVADRHLRRCRRHRRDAWVNSLLILVLSKTTSRSESGTSSRKPRVGRGDVAGHVELFLQWVYNPVTRLIGSSRN